MTIDDLREALKNSDIIDIEFEDYKGNTKFSLKDIDIADVESEGDKAILRLQDNI